MNDQGNIKAVEKSLTEMTEPFARLERNFAKNAPESPPDAPDQGGILKLIDQTTEMLELSLRKMRLARQLLGGDP